MFTPKSFLTFPHYNSKKAKPFIAVVSHITYLSLFMTGLLLRLYETVSNQLYRL